jgi:dTDP-4-dehydrorhamnose 3,5-epimerase
VRGPTLSAPPEERRIRLTPTALPDVMLVRAHAHEDTRGRFAELWNAAQYAAAGLDATFVQHNASYSRGGVLRGMHYQHPRGQGKLISVLSGSVYDAVVDVRLGSPTFGSWFGCELTAHAGTQLWVPPGFAHGFLVLSDDALVHYACTTHYDPAADRCLAWDDPAVGILWPGRPEVLSDKDRTAPRLPELERSVGALPTHDPQFRSAE